MNSCNGKHSCKGMIKGLPDDSVGLDKRRDILPTKTYNNTIQSYGLSSLKNNNGAVTSPQEARQVAAYRSGQSFNQAQSDRKKADRYGMNKDGSGEKEKSISFAEHQATIKKMNQIQEQKRQNEIKNRNQFNKMENEAKK